MEWEGVGARYGYWVIAREGWWSPTPVRKVLIGMESTANGPSYVVTIGMPGPLGFVPTGKANSRILAQGIAGVQNNLLASMTQKQQDEYIAKFLTKLERFDQVTLLKRPYVLNLGLVYFPHYVVVAEQYDGKVKTYGYHGEWFSNHGNDLEYTNKAIGGAPAALTYYTTATYDGITYKDIQDAYLKRKDADKAAGYGVTSNCISRANDLVTDAYIARYGLPPLPITITPTWIRWGPPPSRRHLQPGN